MLNQQADVILETLCCFFDLKKPQLVVFNRNGGGRYSWKWVRRKGRIVGTRRHRIIVNVGPRLSTRSWQSTLLHEFAHYFAHARGKFSPNAMGGHGPGFRRALTDVAGAWYGDPSLYDWQTEYTSLAKLGPCDPE